MTLEEQRRQIREEKKRAQGSKYRSGIESKEANPCFHVQQFFYYFDIKILKRLFLINFLNISLGTRIINEVFKLN